MPDIPSKFQKDPSITFWVISWTHKQTNKQTKTGKNITSLAEVINRWVARTDDSNSASYQITLDLFLGLLVLWQIYYRSPQRLKCYNCPINVTNKMYLTAIYHISQNILSIILPFCPRYPEQSNRLVAGDLRQTLRSLWMGCRGTRGRSLHPGNRYSGGRHSPGSGFADFFSDNAISQTDINDKRCNALLLLPANKAL